MHVTHELELFPEYSVTQMLFTDVKNAAALRKSAMEGQINGALINPAMVRALSADSASARRPLSLKVRISPQLVDPFQALVAANKAVHLQKAGKMKTRSLLSEIIFNLSPTNNISEAFRRFGMSDGDGAVHVVTVHPREDMSDVDTILARVEGRQVPVGEISTFTDVPGIKKLYKVTPSEEKCGSLLEAVVCRMAVKDVV
ncbi:EKC/KEOPS complex subunit TPRKB isoform X1 [Denticeps clupeoides]|uniref:EKC/KEOPS complex subunit TPRKB isoform X1 n=1 Tax=Denticeps clupeoides TaxID=299321 RepID=UPI0010A4E748|nr:EKC/KEOPS complex subunit TPRKB isoform X1 [Denticeps clupeoides]